MSSPTFRQITVLPGVWASPGLLDRLRALSERPPLVLCEWPGGASALDRTDALLAGWKDVLGAEQLRRLPELRYVGLRATSTARVDEDYTRANGIAVSGIHHYGDTGTVEFVVEELLGHVRHRGESRGELAGRRLGLVGYGAVARGVGRVATALGMDVRFHTPTPRESSAGEPQWAPLRELLTGADLLSFHSPAYQHVVTLEELRLVPPTAFVVMTTLGLPMSEADLTAWQSGRPGGVVMDLCTASGSARDVLDLPGIQVRDLYAARTVESVRRAEDQVVDNILAALG
ncbi:glycerate dehydrogenase [Streptacidiphilus sp. MAP12-33]|uniref:NAD(P)-dependent oxidoreductase n=1 Tax=Streptacidiphilus sp. MAP12-33 TaxID=3156266 RepID=UPI003519524D